MKRIPVPSRIVVGVAAGVVAWSVLTLSPQAAAGRESLEGLRPYVEAAMEDWGVPGMAVAVVKDGHIVLAEGFGVRDLRTGDRVDGNTVFAIASNTKAFTATALGLLVQEGRMSWDDPVLDYLPAFQLFDPVVTRRIAVRDLLCHRSGLGTWSGDLASYGSTYDRDEVIRRVRYQEPAGDFRASFGYSNLMFLVAGELIPAVAGASWDEFVAERLFRPLGMRRTRTSVQDLEGMENVATPHTRVDGDLVPISYVNVDNHGPAGAINSSANDMARWLELQLGYGFYAGNQLVDSTVISETRKPHTLLPVSETAKELNPWTHFANYGLGWVLADYRGRLLVYHTGGLDGMYSYTGFLPEENLGVVVLTNADNHNLIRALPHHIYDLYLGADFQDWSRRYRNAYEERERRRDEEKQKQKESRVPGTHPSHPLEDYAGRYESAVYGEAEIEWSDGRLTLHPKAHPHVTGTLEHWQYDTFLCTWTSRVWDESWVHFELGDDGRAVRFRMKVRPDWIDTREYTFVRR